MGRHPCLLAVSLIALALLMGCQRGESDEAKAKEGGGDQTKGQEQDRPPARAGGVVRLSAEAQKNIGLTVEKVARRTVRDTISAAGWLIVRPGAEVVVKSPATGFVLPPAGEDRFGLGSAVKGEEQLLGSLQTLLTPLEQADLVSAKKEADILIGQSLATLQRSEVQLARLKASEGAVAGSRINDLQETIDRARIAYEEAQKKLPFLPKEPYNTPLALNPLPLRAPIAGRVVKVYVAPRQLVAQADPLWTIADWTSLWLRVPVFEGDLPRVPRGDMVQVQVPGTDALRPGTPVDIPQSTEAGRRSVDLYYEVDNADGALRPGQAVAVLLPAGKAAERIVVPRAAVVIDGMGNNWVYVETEKDGFHRRQVELGDPVADGVAVQRGLQDGEQVVSRGAEVLYGEEFKGEMPSED